MSDNPVGQYPGDVVFDLRITVPAIYMDEQVEALEDFLHDHDIDYCYLPGERLPYQHVPDSPAELFGSDELE